MISTLVYADDIILQAEKELDLQKLLDFVQTWCSKWGIESDCLLSAHTLGDALADLICTYFVFDIAYPKSEYALLIFFQHFVLGLKDNQKIPTSVSSLCSSLSS